MKRNLSFMTKIGAALVFSGMLPGAIQACTIFVLTDTNRALFCNNEDWSDPNTRIWFVPAQPKRYGHVYVGFDNGWAQGGLNTEGLAFDWVAGYKEEWSPDPGATCETHCATSSSRHHEQQFDGQRQAIGTFPLLARPPVPGRKQ